jgi:hypothetical protein
MCGAVAIPLISYLLSHGGTIAEFAEALTIEFIG